MSKPALARKIQCSQSRRASENRRSGLWFTPIVVSVCARLRPTPGTANRTEQQETRMGIISFIKGGVAELAIARPDSAKDDWVYKHPDQTIPMKAQLTVDSDEVALR